MPLPTLRSMLKLTPFRACLNFIAIIFIAIFEMDFLLFI
jgi:hypothetical protein